MKLAHRLLGLFADSPNYERDRANLFSGFTIGTAALVLNGAVLFLVLPLMMYPDDSDFRMLTENLEFGQLLALILLGGATAFATFLIPLRMSTVFWGPRIGRYFDQIVLSGISPFRFVIGKATSQNLFVALALFLLLPYLVLSIALGGMNPTTFVCGVILVWLYSMMLAVVTIWVSLYLNELFGALCVLTAASICCLIGMTPIEFNPMVMTPFPVLLHSVYTNIPMGGWYVATDYNLLFISSVVTMLSVTAIALFAIYLGPLYGIITENSTFGEVVRIGDSKKKRWLRLRPHIQRSSEIAFFYENRGDAFRKSEGLIRWGGSLLFLILIAAIAQTGFFLLFASIAATRSTARWFTEDLQIINLMTHGFGLLLAVFLFSHSKNNLYARVPFFRGRSLEVSRLDTVCFFIFFVCSTAGAFAMPILFERLVAAPLDLSIFGDDDFRYRVRRFWVEGTCVLSVISVVLFAIQKFVTHATWLRSAALLGTAGFYLLAISICPFIIAVVYMEFPELRQSSVFSGIGPTLAMCSPFTVFASLTGEFSRRFPTPLATIPFYASHAFVLFWMLIGIRFQRRRVKQQYMSQEEN